MPHGRPSDLREPNVSTPFRPISGLRSVGLAVPNYEESLAFYTSVWGLEVVAEDGGISFLGTVADPRESVPVEMQPGDGLFYLGSVMHGGGANSTADRWRKAVYCGFLLGWLTPEEACPMALTPEQLDELSPGKREQVQKAVAMVGSVVIGKFITRDVVMRLARVAGMRMTTRQAARYVPLAGQVAAAAGDITGSRRNGSSHHARVSHLISGDIRSSTARNGCASVPRNALPTAYVPVSLSAGMTTCTALSAHVTAADCLAYQPCSWLTSTTTV